MTCPSKIIINHVIFMLHRSIINQRCVQKKYDTDYSVTDYGLFMLYNLYILPMRNITA